MVMIKRLIKALASPVFMTFLLVLLIVTLAAATFIENDFGAQVARYKVYNAWWFELVLILLAVNLLIRVFTLKLYKPAKFSVFLFHIAFVVMLMGAGITRYFGEEGTMHIREGQSSNIITTYDKLVTATIYNQKGDTASYEFESNIELERLLDETVDFNDQSIDIRLKKFYHMAQPVLETATNGTEVISFILSGNRQRGLWYLTNGEIKEFQNFTVGFNNTTADVNIFMHNDSLKIRSENSFTVSSMGETEIEIEANETTTIEERKLYRFNTVNIVFQDYKENAQVVASPPTSNNPSAAMKAMIFNVSSNRFSEDITLWQNTWNNDLPTRKTLGDITLEMNYGSREIKLPFSIYLNDFVIDRYPGSMSPSSYSSHVTVLEKGEEPMPYHIYMNNILKYKGYRFFQSSYDDDEQGTILSVNHDPIGTGVTYFGYFLLALGMVWSLINPNTFFRRTRVKVKSLIVMALLAGGSFFTTPTQAQSTNYTAVDKKHATEFGSLLIQNNRGRTEPVYSFASDLIRKIARKNSINELTPAQLFIDMNRRPDYWGRQPIIRVSNGELQETLGLTSKYAAYSDFFRQNRYVMQELVQMAHAKPLASRSKYDKAIIKTDEKINICYGIFSGKYLKIFPAPGNADSTAWHHAEKAARLTANNNDSIFLSTILPAYFKEIASANQNNDYTSANQYLNGIKKFQRENAGYKLPSSRKVQIEILYNKYNPFKTLFPYYLTLGVIYLIMLLVLISSGKEVPRWIRYTFYYALLAGFIVHTIGYAARWYISGYAPMSNGYESMVFISWVTILAGYLFNKKSAFTLTATAVLGGLTLMVANLSFMDPQITNLVPVLQSYWLTIHVSVITAGYGFLALGAILGFLNMLLIILNNRKNSEKITGTYTELTIINHKTLIAGLYLLTIGTFLGAVWANESWGRYWGWDPKETWALISIIVYTIVTHARMIPGMRGHFVFNALSLWGFSSIIMTYFGVNYYLSGLHSYAGGDPVPVPVFVYYTVAGLIGITVWASVKNEKSLKTL